MPQEFLDFELSVDPAPDGYTVSVVRSPMGEAKELVVFPFDQSQLDVHLLRLQLVLAHSTGGPRRRVLSKEEESVKALGAAFFDFLLPRTVGSLFYESRREAERGGRGLRLKLRMDAPELAALPWEFLHDPRNDDYLCLASDTPLVRYLPVAQATRPLTVKPPLRILGMVASPNGYEALDVAAEQHRVEKALAHLQADGLVELTWLNGGSWRALQREMRRSDWHIFHFIGHGGFNKEKDEGFLAFVDDNGEAERVHAKELARLLKKLSLRLALLNACEGARGGQYDVFSSTAATLAQSSLPAVVAMQYAISDRAAVEFARSFYEALADGLPVDAAVTEARVAMRTAHPNSVEWGTPVLYLRAADGALFEWGDSPAEAQTRKGEEEQQKAAKTQKHREEKERQETAAANKSAASTKEQKSADNAPIPLDNAAVSQLRGQWNDVLTAVREQSGPKQQAALRAVRDIAIGENAIALAFGNNKFAKDIISEAETLAVVSTILAQFIGRQVAVECQEGETATLSAAKSAASTKEQKSADNAPGPLDNAAESQLRDQWNDVLAAVREQSGPKQQAALRTVRDVAIGENAIALAFGNNKFAKDIISEAETLAVVSTILAQFVGRQVAVECQEGETATLSAAAGRIVRGEVEMSAVIVRPPLDFDWVTIPAGEFVMGSDKKVDSMARDSEMPQFKLHLPEYRIARVPVTNGQYARFVKATGYAAPQHWASGRIPDGKEEHPVVYVSWRDAIAFCDWAGAQLPSEAQWEKAARGTDGGIWPWGNQPPDKERCNFDGNVGDTTAVGAYPAGASPYWTWDMAGNVWEWCRTKWRSNYEGYAKIASDDLTGDDSRVLRGGSWDDSSTGVRAAGRYGFGPDNRFNLVGFRLVAPGL